MTRKVELSDYPTAELKQNLYVLVITNKRFAPSDGKGKVLAIGSIHSQELTPAETLLRFAEYLLQNHGSDPEVNWILDYSEIHIIVHANPDGRVFLERGGHADETQKMWRKNRNDDCDADSWRFGVDLNRNFPFKWAGCDASENCSRDDCSAPTYRGPGRESEQETRAIVDYAASIFPSSQRKGNLQKSESELDEAFPVTSRGVFIDAHSFGRDVGWPWGFADRRAPNDEGLGALGRKMASYASWDLWAPGTAGRTCE